MCVERKSNKLCFLHITVWGNLTRSQLWSGEMWCALSHQALALIKSHLIKCLTQWSQRCCACTTSGESRNHSSSLFSSRWAKDVIYLSCVWCGVYTAYWTIEIQKLGKWFMLCTSDQNVVRSNPRTEPVLNPWTQSLTLICSALGLCFRLLPTEEMQIVERVHDGGSDDFTPISNLM